MRIPDTINRASVRWVILALAALALLALAAPAYAVTIDTEGSIYAEKCTPCHANIADSKSSEIIFKHGYHMRFSCESCHTSFPHRPEGTVVPDMKGCFGCHGLRHGPQGIIASAKCESCHRTPRAKLRPKSHIEGWKGKPHVQPAIAKLRTECMMCHDRAWCDDCHRKTNVDWTPTEAFTYDAGEGCMACHADSSLARISAAGMKTYEVTGVDTSAHRKLTCQQCHEDFKYYDGADATPVWSVNAGLACQGCHEHEKQTRVYEQSVHGQKLLAGDLESATCASCHGGHYIQRLNTQQARDDLHASAYRMCAHCHEQQYVSYDDYYHGAAYKRGAPDAPACWQCHGAHDILPAADDSSTVNAANLAKTCGKCHEGSQERFADEAARLIHRKGEARSDNAVLRVIERLRAMIGWGSSAKG